MRYRGYNIYSIEKFGKGHQWRVQTGYHVVGDYDTIKGAKLAITHDIKRSENITN